MKKIRKILIASPCFGGQVTTAYVESLLKTIDRLKVEKIDYKIMTITNESLITRARNTLASEALRQGRDLFFLDADLSWSAENFMKVLEGEGDVCGGTYPVKSYPITMNFNPFKESEVRADTKGFRNLESIWRIAKQEGKEFKVAHVPTGFMRIRLPVLQKFSNSKFIGSYERAGKTDWDFFKVGPRGKDYLSEDWFFCEHARYEGFSVTLHSEAICEHIGTHTFQT